MKNIVFMISALVLLSLQSHARCPEMLYYDQLLALFQGEKVNTGNDILQKEAGADDEKIFKSMTDTFYPARYIWADLVSGDNNGCSYDWRRGLTYRYGDKIRFRVAYVVAEPEFTYDQAVKHLKLQMPVNKNSVQLKYKNFINQFNEEKDKTAEKIKKHNTDQNAYAVVFNKLGVDFEQFRKELEEKTEK